MTVRDDEERRSEAQGSLPPALPPEAMPVEVEATAAQYQPKSAITRRAVAAALVVLVAVQLLWIVALVLWVIRIVW